MQEVFNDNVLIWKMLPFEEGMTPDPTGLPLVLDIVYFHHAVVVAAHA